jgi:hypothetical protein
MLYVECTQISLMVENPLHFPSMSTFMENEVILRDFQRRQKWIFHFIFL